ncbi:MAG TPA: dethiobiotin synthase [Polyangiaceae bacterium]|nr:dethiobiotin synthase [Polyangiaceae bacterium]
MSHPPRPVRIVLVGTGTSVGKTWLATELLRELARRAVPAVGLKPIESGVVEGVTSDAEQLAGLSAAAPATPPFRLPEPISPHLAARRAGVAIALDAALTYVRSQESSSAQSAPRVVLVETAGGLFSPLTDSATCFELARALDPARWVLVAADALGVIHDVTAALLAAKARGRVPDFVVLSAARAADASTGSNAAELARLGIVQRPFALGRDDSAGVAALVDALLEPAATAP